MQEFPFFWVSGIVLAGFVLLFGFEIRIVTYLKQMRDLLKEIAKKINKKPRHDLHPLHGAPRPERP